MDWPSWVTVCDRQEYGLGEIGGRTYAFQGAGHSRFPTMLGRSVVNVKIELEGLLAALVT